VTYLLDANVYIEANNLHYGMDFCPAFWDWLKVKYEAGKVWSIDKVYDELQAVYDEVSNWTRQQDIGMFRKTDSRIFPHLATVSAWVMGQSYTPAAVNTFMQVADYYLIAHALAEGYVVVTHEKPADSPKRVKIPNVCAGLNLRFMNPYEMLRCEQARFVLGSGG
jgi:hypothetical protein